MEKWPLTLEHLSLTQIPVAIPPNLDPAVAKQVIEYLKADPEAAQQSYEQAHRMLRTPGMAQMMLDSKVHSAFLTHGTPRNAHARMLSKPAA